MTLYAVVYTESKFIQAIIPDHVYHDEQKAWSVALERQRLTGLNEDGSMYIVIPITVQDEPISVE